MYKYEAEEYITDAIKAMGYDGITHIGGGRYNKNDATRHRVFIAFDPEQIKSSDSVTYDDAGKPIPVSERYNREKGDIRYALDEVDGTYFVRAEQNLFVKEDGTPYSEREIFDSLVGKTISLPDGDVKIVKEFQERICTMNCSDAVLQKAAVCQMWEH